MMTKYIVSKGKYIANLFTNPIVKLTNPNIQLSPWSVDSGLKYLYLIAPSILSKVVNKVNHVAPFIPINDNCFSYSKTWTQRDNPLVGSGGKRGGEADPQLYHNISRARLEELKKKLLEMKAAIAKQEEERLKKFKK